MDNDAAMEIPCADTDCQKESIVVCAGNMPVDPLPPASEWPNLVNMACTDGMDNDNNMFTDCGDFSCSDSPEVPACHDLPPEADNAGCSDTIDNDKDGLLDCADPGCGREGIVVCMGTNPVMPPPTPAEQVMLADAECSDMNDNDSNTYTDCADFGCSQNPIVTVCNSENTDARCMDGMDNDNNGFTDCDDFACSKSPFITVCVTETSYMECSNGIDDDGNGFADCDDFSCNPMTGPKSPACN
jgi:hypothetical protein